jgi:hypothetical protein
MSNVTILSDIIALYIDAWGLLVARLIAQRFDIGHGLIIELKPCLPSILYSGSIYRENKFGVRHVKDLCFIMTMVCTGSFM